MPLWARRPRTSSLLSAPVDHDRAVLRREDVDLYLLAHAAGVEVVFEQHRGLVRRGRAFEGQAGDGDQDASAREVAQGRGEAFGAVEAVEGLSDLGEAGSGVERELGAEREDEEVVVELAAIGAHVALLEVDVAHFGVDELDAVTREPGAIALDRLGTALAGHDPEVGGREGRLLLAIDDDDARGRRQQPASFSGCDDATDTAAEDQNDRVSQTTPLSSSLAEGPDREITNRLMAIALSRWRCEVYK